jgi:peptidoglycan/xylan/chitin deacetylase (PgdA/CDA1 family)
VLTVPGLLDLRALELALEAAFWTGVRSVATERELLRLTRSSYVALYYHRIAGEPGDERLDVPPRLFEAQLRLLRLLRFHPLSRHELLSFHTDPGALLPGRSYLLTADDGFLDAALALGQASGHAPQLFVATQLVGGRAPWAEGARLASWDDLEAAAAKGVAVGSHTRSHPVLPELAPEDLEDELAGSLADLRRHLPDVLPVLAYPHGRHDTATRHAAAAAGYRAGYTTAPGRNGAGSDPYRLSRIGIKAWDSRLAFLWRAATGEHLPRPWERWRLWLYRRGLTPGARRRQGGA